MDTQVIQTIASTRANHGGTSRCVPELCDALADLNCQVHLVVGMPSTATDPSLLPSPSTKIHTCTESRLTGRWRLGRSFFNTIDSLASEGNILVHDNGMWLPTNHAVAVACRKRRIPRIVSPHGMAGDWAMRNGRWKKRIAWAIYQRRDLLSATAFHATSDQEAAEIRQLGLKQPISIIPNGIPSPKLPTRTRTDDEFHVLFMSRIHPKKGLPALINAWHQARLPNKWRLILAGPDEVGHRQEVADLVHKLDLHQQITFIGPVDDDDKWQTYVNSDLFVLPSINENFGIVVAESLLAGVPVIASTGTPWQSLTTHNCGWWVSPNSETLAQTLQSIASMPRDELRQMGVRGSAYVAKTYSWQKVAQQMLDFYQGVVNTFHSPIPHAATR